MQEIRDNTWSEMFPFAEDQAACADATALSGKLHAKLRHCIPEELRNKMRKARELPFISLGYRSLLSRHISHSDDEKERETLSGRSICKTSL